MFNPKSLKLGLYCHVPFCAHKCSYCAFYQEAPRRQTIEDYIWGIEKEFSLLKLEKSFDTIYIGGGTPGVLTAKYFEKLCQILTQKNSSKTFEEFSVEFSPTTIQKEKIKVLQNYGCNRITIGVQSFNEKTLKILGRQQSPQQIYYAYDILTSCNFENIGIDLIFAVPGQTLDDWMQDLQKAIDLQPKHISTYNLTFEENTPLSDNLHSKIIQKKEEDEECNFYIKTWNFLEKNGYKQYEISNFCKSGYHSKHNCDTWAMQDWLGVGPAACSQYQMERFANPSSIKTWLNSLRNDQSPYINREKISQKQLIEDSIIFGLRTTAGVNITQLKQKNPAYNFSKLENFCEKLQLEGLMTIKDERISLTTKGRLLTDSIAVDILNIF